MTVRELGNESADAGATTIASAWRKAMCPIALAAPDSQVDHRLPDSVAWS
jgi:hypothetical protein